MANAARAVFWPYLLSRVLVLTATELGAYVSSGALTRPTWSLTDFYHADALRYQSIWEHGYHDVVTSSFFPLFPYSARALGWIIGAQVAGLVIPEIALLAAMMLVYAIGDKLIGSSGASLSLWVLAFWPWSVFFSYPYTESLLLLATAASLWLGGQRRWLLAGIAGALAAASRAPGILLEFAFGADLLRELRGRRWRPNSQVFILLAAMLLTACGLVLVGAVLQSQTGDFLGFFKGQETYVIHRNPLFPVGAVVEMVRNLNPFKVEGLGLLVAIAFGAGTVWVVRALPSRYAAYSAASFILFVYQGWHLGQYHSVPRYLAPLFPVYFAFAVFLERRPKMQVPWLAVSGCVMAIEAVLYGADKFVG